VSAARRATGALAALMFGAFAMGTAELIIVGILDQVALALGISVSQAGGLVTSYALGIAIGGPVATALTGGAPRQSVLIGALAVFVLGALVMVVGSSVPVLLAARFMTGTVHGLFIGAACMVAASVAAPGGQGRAIGLVIGGIAVSTVVGVPLGVLVARAAGWEAAFVGTGALGLLALAATAAFVPATPASGQGRLFGQMREAVAPRVLALLGIGFLLIGGQFLLFTYLVPYLQDVTGVTGNWVSAFLLAYGVACTAGTFVGGRFADWSASKTLIGANAALVAILGAVYLLGGSPALIALALAAWGIVGFGLIPALQFRVITLAGRGGDLAATLSASVINVGIAAGSLVGGFVLARDGAAAVALAAMGVCALALPATWATRHLGSDPAA
jgi:DHA1 family inner membrane transport protein